MEIERQFLVDDIKSVPLDMARRRYSICQGYISFNPEMRIRQLGNEYFFTFKSSGGLVRREEEFKISEKDFLNLMPRITGKMLNKSRYEVMLDSGQIAIFDVYEDDLSGMYMAEVEFDDVDDANAFTPPEWFGREITYDTRLTAANIVKHGLKWFEGVLSETR